jgi:hypothetical protein
MTFKVRVFIIGAGGWFVYASLRRRSKERSLASVDFQGDFADLLRENSLQTGKNTGNSSILGA